MKSSLSRRTRAARDASLPSGAKTVRSVLALFAMTSIVVLAPDRAQAANVTKVNAPDLQRPPDGKVYPFTVAVSGTYNNAERTNPGEIIMTAWYLDGDQPIGWNPAIDQPIHKRNFLVPAYDPNTQANNWSVDVEFLVGCTTQVEVFGDAMNMGVNTDEDPMDDGYFHFNQAGANGSEWIRNTVSCFDGTTGTATNYRDMQPVPEPATNLLVLAAIVLVPRRPRAS